MGWGYQMHESDPMHMRKAPDLSYISPAYVVCIYRTCPLTVSPSVYSVAEWYLVRSFSLAEG
jgi:hypothetical protein